MRISLDYGRNTIDAEISDGNLAGILKISPEPPLDSPERAIRAAVVNPIGCAPLSELAKGRRDACVVICDITRPVPNKTILPILLETLADAGIPPDKVTILIATGTHRPNLGDELREMLGEATLNSGARVENHVCDDESTHTFLGVTENGVPVALNSRWVDADLRLSVGLIEPHFMAGYSGGRKLVMPGIAGLKTVQAWHSPRFLEHENARAGVLENNPVHEENTKIAAMAPAHFLCDVTIDAARNVTGVFAGHWIDAWRAGVEFVAKQVRATLPEPVDITITSAGGFPLDATFYQTVKGIVMALPITKPGGTIVICAALTEGVGGPHFTKTLKTTPNLVELVQRMQRSDWVPIPDQWQVEELAKAVRAHTIVVVTDGLSPEMLRQCHVEHTETLDDALADALEKHGPTAKIAVIPKGPYVLCDLETA